MTMSNNGMSYLLVLTLIKITENAGAGIYRKLGLAIQLCYCVKAMLKEQKMTKDAEIVEAELAKLNAILEAYDPMIDEDKYSVGKKAQFEIYINQCLGEIYRIAYKDELINPSAIGEQSFAGFGSVKRNDQ